MAKEQKTEEVQSNEVAGITTAYFEEKGAKSAANKQNNGSNVEVSLVDTFAVRFTKDFGKHIKKGNVMTVSAVAYEIYAGKGVVEKVN